MPEEYGMLSKTGLITLPCGECVPIGRKKLNTGYGTMGCTEVEVFMENGVRGRARANSRRGAKKSAGFHATFFP